MGDSKLTQTEALAEFEKAVAAGTPKKAPSERPVRRSASAPKVVEAPKTTFGEIAQIFRDIPRAAFAAAKGVQSSDVRTRNFSILFFVASLGIVLALGGTITRITRNHGRLKAPALTHDLARLGELIHKQAESNRVAARIITLGSFTFEVKRTDADPNKSMSLAQVEIVLECDSRETRTFIETHLAQAQNQITNMSASIDRDELLSREGKQRFQKQLIESLNSWLPEGKVQSLYFTKLAMI